MTRRIGWAVITASAGLWLSIQMDDLRRARAPASDWLEVRALHVYDAWDGESPYISYDRDIKSSFRGIYTVTVRPMGGDGNGCLPMEGRADYSPTAILPPNRTLDWLTWPHQCRLTPGRYRVDVAFQIMPDGYPDKTLRAVSNIFEVHPVDWRRSVPP